MRSFVFIVAASFIITIQSPRIMGAKILGIFPVGAKSHFAVDRSIMKSLHDVGHQITIICPFDETKPVENFTVISMTFSSLESTTQGSIEEFVKLPLYSYLQAFVPLKLSWCDNFLASDYVQNLLNSPVNLFDLLVVEYTSFDPCFTIIAEKFDIPVILTSPIQSAIYVDSLFGNPSHPAAIPAGISFMPQHLNFVQRMQNAVHHLYVKFLFYVIFDLIFEKIDRQLRDQFGIRQWKPFSVLFQNSHSSLLARPLVQNVIEIGGIHIEPRKPLPQNIQQFMDESSAGVILFTFGSIARGSFLSPSTVSLFKQVFAQIPQRVIWKYEGTIEDLPKNVMISDWLPQRDILAHKNMVAFITHCGLGGIYEAIYESVPLVMIPFFGDQLPNAAALEEKGVGVVLNALKLSVESLQNTLDLVVNDTRYRENMRNLSRRFKDRPMTPQESVVYWTEYVIAHQGALHLRSSFADMPTYQYFFLDVLSILGLALIVLYVLVLLLMRFCFHNKTIKCGKEKKQN